MRITTFLLSLAIAAPAAGDVYVRFDEGAPKDRFTFKSHSACLDGPLRLTVDLSGSDAGLIFDVTGAGQGVEVFQPFELVAGGSFVIGHDAVVDGDTELSMELQSMPKGTPVSFTIDLDDTGGGREITVNDAEIAGAQVRIEMGSMTATGRFGDDATAVVQIADCAS